MAECFVPGTRFAIIAHISTEAKDQKGTAATLNYGEQVPSLSCSCFPLYIRLTLQQIRQTACAESDIRGTPHRGRGRVKKVDSVGRPAQNEAQTPPGGHFAFGKEELPSDP